METETIECGQDFTVNLEANVQSGYMWYVEPRLDNKIILTKQINHPKKNYTGTVQIFHFLATEKGEVEVKFVYKRSWENRGYREHTIKLIIQ